MLVFQCQVRYQRVCWSVMSYLKLWILTQSIVGAPLSTQIFRDDRVFGSRSLLLTWIWEIHHLEVIYLGTPHLNSHCVLVQRVNHVWYHCCQIWSNILLPSIIPILNNLSKHDTNFLSIKICYEDIWYQSSIYDILW